MANSHQTIERSDYMPEVYSHEIHPREDNAPSQDVDFLNLDEAPVGPEAGMLTELYFPPLPEETDDDTEVAVTNNQVDDDDCDDMPPLGPKVWVDSSDDEDEDNDGDGGISEAVLLTQLYAQPHAASEAATQAALQ